MVQSSAGKRNCLCKLMANTGGERDSRGHQSDNPTEVGRLWCSIRQLSAQESLVFNQLYASATHEVIGPYSKSMNPSPEMWLDHQGRILEIVGVENIEERNIEWRFLCSEKVAVRDGDT